MWGCYLAIRASIQPCDRSSAVSDRGAVRELDRDLLAAELEGGDARAEPNFDACRCEHALQIAAV
jgi:hypothetical protein